jgi:signal transduction histidine kinase
VKKLEKISGSKSFLPDMVAMYVHEVKNCLNFLLAKADSENDRQSMHVLMEANYKLNHLLMLYKIEAGALSPTSNAVYPQRMLSLLAADFQGLVNHQIEVVDGDESDVAYFDEALVSLCCGNAITNADRYAASTIQLSYRLENQRIIISVRDDGPGFPEEILTAGGDKILNSTDGSGLGLYLSAQIAQAHKYNQKHGFIKLRNDHGGVFEMHLP